MTRLRRLMVVRKQSPDMPRAGEPMRWCAGCQRCSRARPRRELGRRDRLGRQPRPDLQGGPSVRLRLPELPSPARPGPVDARTAMAPADVPLTPPTVETPEASTSATVGSKIV